MSESIPSGGVEQSGYDFDSLLERFVVGDETLLLNRIRLQVVPQGGIIFDDTTPWSKRDRTSDSIVIGTQRVPGDVFGWGTESVEQDTLLKVAHELSHTFQDKGGYENALTTFLSGQDQVDEKYVPYIELYTLLTGTNRFSVLSGMQVYHDQTKAEAERVTEGLALDVTVLEDITELLAAYMLGEEYFAQRLHQAGVTNEQKFEAIRLVVEIFKGI